LFENVTLEKHENSKVYISLLFLDVGETNTNQNNASVTIQEAARTQNPTNTFPLLLKPP